MPIAEVAKTSLLHRYSPSPCLVHLPQSTLNEVIDQTNGLTSRKTRQTEAVLGSKTLCLHNSPFQIMIDINQFRSVARVVRVNQGSMPKMKLPEPHGLALEVLTELGGVVLEPISIIDGCEISFGAHDAPCFESMILQINSVFVDNHFPIASADGGNGILLLNPCGIVYSLQLAAGELSYFDSLDDAIWRLLCGKPLTPILPIRPYKQEYGWNAIEPGAQNVVWVDTPHWHANTCY